MKLLPISALVTLTACGPVVGDAMLLVPEEVELHWDQAFNGDEDGLVAIVPIDVMVFDAESAEPISAAEIEVTALGDGYGLVPAGAIRTVDGDCAVCEPLWDAHRDRYVSIEEEPATTLRRTTDRDGLVRLHVVVDSVDGEEASGLFELLPLTAASDTVDATFYLVPR